MNILFDLNHPAHVHLFRNAITILQKKGHTVIITARDKDVTLKLLKQYDFAYKVLSKMKHGLFGLAKELFIRESKIFSILKKNRINVCVSATGACSVHACKLLRIPSLVFYDSEGAHLQNALTIPFTTRYFTPDCYMKREGKNHETYKGVHELAYLHPAYYNPDDKLLGSLKLDKEEKYIVMRFVAWEAAHDKGKKGLTLADKMNIIKCLSKSARIFVLSETALPGPLTEFQYQGPVDLAHDLLYYAAIHIGEGATMVSESACLGTPSIYINPIKLGYIREEEKYGLVFDLNDPNEVIRKAKEILDDYNPGHWNNLRDKFINDKIDVTAFIVEKIEEYGKK